MERSVDLTSPQVLDAMLRERGLDVPPETLVDLAEAVQDLWQLGAQVHRDLATLSESVAERGDRDA